ncbi:hypothetical protein, partial [Mesorhizobium sp. M0571]|uniref:hypothetical protein n=1 Tax=Mesorhizobium sp. M0571 TaxID=2956960 RepID=UPI0033376BA9
MSATSRDGRRTAAALSVRSYLALCEQADPVERTHHGVDRLGGDMGIERGRINFGMAEQPRVIMLTFYVIENQSAVERDRLLAGAAAHSA